MTAIKIDQIRIDGGTQSRVSLNQDTVSEYAEAITNGDKFPLMRVFFDGADYWLADGFHRYFAYIKASFEEAECAITQGTARDARLYSVGANHNHGLRRTNEDKRKAVQTLLDDPEWGKWSENEIAKRCNVSHDTVRRIKKENLTCRSSSDKNENLTCRSSSDNSEENGQVLRKYIDKHGNESVMNVANIGKKKEEPDVDDEEEIEEPANLEDYDPRDDQLKELSYSIAELNEENEKLKHALAVNQIPEGIEIEDAATIIESQREKIKKLEFELKSTTDAMNRYMVQLNSAKQLIKRQAFQLKKLGAVGN